MHKGKFVQFANQILSFVFAFIELDELKKLPFNNKSKRFFY